MTTLQDIQHPKPSLKSRPILVKKAKWRYKMSSDTTYINKYKPKMLSTIQLDLIDVKQIGNLELRNLQRALKDNKRHSSLILKHHNSNYQETRNIEHLLTVTNRWKSLKLSKSDQLVALKPQDLEALTRLRRCQGLRDFDLMLNCGEPHKNMILRRLSKQFEGLNQIKSLAFDIQSCDRARFGRGPNQNYDENVTVLTFKFPPSLSSLNLAFGGGYLMDELFSKFTKNIHQCSSIEHLNLDTSRLFDGIERMERNTWSSLFEKTQNLKTFTLKAVWSYPLSNREAQAFLGSLQHLKQLTALKFHFAFSSTGGVLELFLHDLFHNLASLPNLTSLNLDYRDSQLPKDLGSNNLFMNLQHLVRLQQLHFSCSNCSNIGDTFLQQFASALQHLHNLKQFHLFLPNSEVTDTGMISLTESLKELTHLQDLTLDFDSCNSLDNRSLEILSKGIVHLNLASLNLFIKQPKTKSFLSQLVSFWKDKKELTSFSSALERSHHLSSLSLNLSTYDISSKELKSFSCALKKLQSLTSFSLELPQLTSENNFEGFMSVASVLKDLSKLKLLHLLASRGAKLRDQEIIFLISNTRQCRLVEDLKLCFDQANPTGESFRHVLSGIKDLVLLKHLYLGLGSDQGERELLYLFEGLTAFKKLETLGLKYPMQFEKDLLTRMYYRKLRHLTSFVRNYYYYSQTTLMSLQPATQELN